MRLLAYRALLYLLAPFLLGYSAWQGRGSGRYLRERCGLYPRTPRRGVIWCHAASVGEVNGMLPLLTTLYRNQAQRPLLLTTSTPSGAAVALGKIPEGVIHAYLPIDWPGAARRFLRFFRPDVGIIMETELWPNLYRAAATADVSLCIVNGRLSPRTLGAPAWLRALYGDCLRQTRRVFARSEADRDRFIALGADGATTEVMGNLKFAALGEMDAPAPVGLGRPYVLAASTRAREEAAVFAAWQTCDHGDYLLVIAPRHPKRLAEILAAVEQAGLSVAVRSRSDQIGEKTDVYIADTFNELIAFMAAAELIFMGGSLVPVGGHNILEPAALGRAIITGPYMDNFSDEIRLLLSHDAAIQVASADELGQQMGQLLRTPERRAELGRHARQVVTLQGDVAELYYRALRDACADSFV